MMIVLVYGEIKKNGRGETHISKVSQPAAGSRILVMNKRIRKQYFS
jgi:hypothetical protein